MEAMDTPSLWERFCSLRINYEELGFSFDFSRMKFPDDYISSHAKAIEGAYKAMSELEAGAIANPDENRMVGHYWLRAPELTPDAALKAEIVNALASIKKFAEEVHSGAITAPDGKKFTDLLLVGIGGSALGPQFIAEALGSHEDKMRVHFLDNTDPDGIDKVLEQLRSRLAHVLVVVISKSGGTKETRNGMLEVQATMEVAGLNFEKQAVAVTGDGSQLDQTAVEGGWLARFPMWDWVGGRTSIMSAVGLLPMALQGLDIDKFLAGAAAMDALTRVPATDKNAAMMLALMWHYAGGGRGTKDMVVLPYKDRLMLFSKYLQQLVMESLGKELDLDGQVVNQGIAVYGNKGSTDQHAYVQQLRDGVLNFFVTFLEVRKSRNGHSFEVDPGVTTGDYLQGFLRGTRTALYENGRESITISVSQVDAFNVGALIALYERAVGFYASLVNINAYHQPGVEAGKKAAAVVLELKAKVEGALAKSAGEELTADDVATRIDADPEAVYHLLRHLAANHPEIRRAPGPSPKTETFTQSA